MIIATIAYFFIALEVILDKFFLSSKRVSHPSIYAFYSGVLSFFTILLFPFGFHSITFLEFIYSIAAGIIFIYGVLFLFFAIKKNEASRVTPLIGAVISIITFLLSLFFLREKLDLLQLLGIAILVFGGLFISAESLIKGKRKFFSGFYQVILGGILLALASVLFKSLYKHDNFINVFIWTRMGLTVGALSLMLFPDWRKMIISSLANFKKPKLEEKNSGIFFVTNKLLGGLGSILLHFTISLGSVTIINALVSVEYIFIFLMGVIFSSWVPGIFQEKKDWKNFLQKITAIFIITLGILLVSGYKFCL
jgi:drug/metabolite transporter (DMT)-like permease